MAPTARRSSPRCAKGDDLLRLLLSREALLDGTGQHASSRLCGSVAGLACCAIGRGEVVATFHRHFREKRLTQREFRQLALQVEADLEVGLWTALPVTSSLIEVQTHRMAMLPASVFLRAADALHLACAAEARLREVYSSDRHLMAAAPHFGLRAVTL
jgi:predicted nucleic acid-binding protein